MQSKIGDTYLSIASEMHNGTPNDLVVQFGAEVLKEATNPEIAIDEPLPPNTILKLPLFDASGNINYVEFAEPITSQQNQAFYNTFNKLYGDFYLEYYDLEKPIQSAPARTIPVTEEDKTKMNKFVTSIITTIVLSSILGCASISEKVLQAGTSGAIQFSAVDVDAAIIIAQQTKDIIAENCLKTIRKYIGEELKLETKGPVSIYMVVRAKSREIKAGLSDEVQIACAPLIIDAATFTSTFGLKITGALIQ